MNILVCGLLWSGSSALIDMLKEYSTVGVIPGELDEFRRPGMLMDHLDGLIDDTYPCQIESYLKTQYKLSRKQLKKVLTGDIYSPKRWFALRSAWRKLLIENTQQSKLNVVRKYLEEIKMLHTNDKPYTVIDQPLILSQHFNIWPKVFAPFKLIFVYRDPRDQIAQIIKQNHLFLHFRSPEQDIYGGGRYGAIKYQLHTLQKRQMWMDKLLNEHGVDAISFSFESLITKNTLVRDKLIDFLGVTKSDKFQKVLEPNISEKNIGIYREYLTEGEMSLLEELYQEYKKRENRNNFYQ